MIEDIYNYLELSDTLATSGQPTEAQIADIARAGYLLVVNLALTGTDYALPDEDGSVRAQGMEYTHIPVIWDRPTLQDLETFYDVLDANQQRKVFIHCAANMRVSVFMALYRIQRQGWARSAAFQDVLRIWEPNETWQAFIASALD